MDEIKTTIAGFDLATIRREMIRQDCPHTTREIVSASRTALTVTVLEIRAEDRPRVRSILRVYWAGIEARMG